MEAVKNTKTAVVNSLNAPCVWSIGVGAILNTILEIMACVTFWLLDAKGILDGKAKQPSKEENKDSESQENVEGQEQSNDTPVEPTDENAQKPLLDNSSPENE